MFQRLIAVWVSTPSLLLTPAHRVSSPGFILPSNSSLQGVFSRQHFLFMDVHASQGTYPYASLCKCHWGWTAFLQGGERVAHCPEPSSSEEVNWAGNCSSLHPKHWTDLSWSLRCLREHSLYRRWVNEYCPLLNWIFSQSLDFFLWLQWNLPTDLNQQKRWSGIKTDKWVWRMSLDHILCNLVLQKNVSSRMRLSWEWRSASPFSTALWHSKHGRAQVLPLLELLLVPSYPTCPECFLHSSRIRHTK